MIMHTNIIYRDINVYPYINTLCHCLIFLLLSVPCVGYLRLSISVRIGSFSGATGRNMSKSAES